MKERVCVYSNYWSCMLLATPCFMWGLRFRCDVRCGMLRMALLVAGRARWGG